MLKTKKKPAGGAHRGSIGNWDMIQKNLRELLRDGDAWTSTMLDFYGLPEDFPGKENVQDAGDPYKNVEYLEKCFKDKMQHNRFIPFLVLFEFEALLFSSPKAVSEHFDCPKLADELEAAVEKAGSPERINHGANTHPKERLKNLVKVGTMNKKRYGALTDGPSVLEKIGIKNIRDECPHFGDWLNKLESIGSAVQ